MSRSATKGVVVYEKDEKICLAIEINSETDFVAKNKDFLDFVKEISQY